MIEPYKEQAVLDRMQSIRAEYAHMADADSVAFLVLRCAELEIKLVRARADFADHVAPIKQV